MAYDWMGISARGIRRANGPCWNTVGGWWWVVDGVRMEGLYGPAVKGARRALCGKRGERDKHALFGRSGVVFRPKKGALFLHLWLIFSRRRPRRRLKITQSYKKIERKRKKSSESPESSGNSALFSDVLNFPRLENGRKIFEIRTYPLPH